MTIYAVGDIHGQSDMLRTALDLLRIFISPADTVVFLGDYIDRGPDSRGVINIIRAFSGDHPDTITLRGNHEQMMLDCLGEDAYSSEGNWRDNGGIATLQSFGAHTADWQPLIDPDAIDFLQATQMEHAAPGYRFVHAGFAPACNPHWGERRLGASIDPRLWIRDDFIGSPENFGGIVVFGHTVQPTGLPLVMPNKIGIDTGATFGPRIAGGGRLTVLACPSVPQGTSCDTKTLRYFQVNEAGQVHFPRLCA